MENDHRYFHQDHRLDVLNNHDLTLLRSFPNVVVTPHIAFYSDNVTAEMV
ncbi:lactate dehydrogenase, partial [Acinetobacter baumannii]